MKNNQVESNIKIIKIAILAEEPLGWGSGKHYFPVILNNFSWKKEHQKYKFLSEYIYDKDIIKGKLNIDNFNVFLVPGGGVGDGEAIAKGFNIFRKIRKWKKQVQKFVEDGGSYVGICGGTALCTGLITGPGKKPTSFYERQYKKSSIGITCVNSYYKDLALPLFNLFQTKNPEKIGATGYVFSFAPGETTDGNFIHTGGVPIDFQINKDHPIFSDFPDNKLRIRWWGGPGLIIPDDCDREVSILARYPKKDFSEAKSTKIFAWKYNGGVLGFISAFFRAFNLIKKGKMNLKDIFMYTYYLAGDWKKTNKEIHLNYSNIPSITAEIYPNANQGRIILCTSHPEYMIWHKGFIEEVSDSCFNCLGKGFHRWKNISSLSKTLVEDVTYTWWLIRRFAAWAAKVPDNHLPPIKKEEITDEVKKIINENIYWDGTLIDQMKNI